MAQLMSRAAALEEWSRTEGYDAFMGLVGDLTTDSKREALMPGMTDTERHYALGKYWAFALITGDEGRPSLLEMTLEKSKEVRRA